MHTHKGKELLYRHYAELKKAIASGVVDDTKAVGVLDQWLIEGKYTEEEALVLSCDLLAAGMDTVSIMCRSSLVPSPIPKSGNGTGDKASVGVI